MNPSLLQIAKNTILTESKTLENLASNLDESFEVIIKLLFNCKGRIIVTGIGKSALIAQKIVATLNSTGSPSIYMHAGDAIHGDLGMVTKEDILICLSKSGQTAEFKLIVPLVKAQGTCVIAISSELESYLIKNSDYSILIPIDSEAEPNNIIPTSSTTAQLAIGDAIAITLLSLRGFTPKDFASFHPGGSLGKQLFLKVEDLFSLNAKPAIFPEYNVRQAIIEMTSKRLGATVVVDSDDNILGIITDGDLRRMLQSDKDVNRLNASQIMTSSPITVEAGSLAYGAFQKMRELSISQIIVENKGKYMGMIHIHDFIKEGFL